MSSGNEKTRFEIFISSRMKEFSAERRMLYDIIPTLGNDIVDLQAWVYEINAPASDHTIRDNYLKTLVDSELYIAILGEGYGEWTVDEFNIATRESIPRHVYVLVMDDEKRDKRQSAFIKQIQGVEFGIAPRYFTNIDDLRRAVADSVQVWLRERLLHRAGSTSATFARHSSLIEGLPQKLIGRENLIEDVNPVLNDGETVLLRGFGGMGKTALAATIAKQWIEAGKGAVLWQKLGSENLDTVFQALAHPFNAQQTIAAAQSEDEKRSLIRQFIITNEVQLVVLDDAWDGKTLKAVLDAIPNGIPVLVTSRQRYGLRKIVDVGELSPEKALETLSFYAAANYANDASAKSLCQHLGYHAFALEIAGRTIIADNLTPTVLLERVKDAPHYLKAPDEFAEEGRANVADLITASLTMLDNETQRVFLAMGAFFAKRMTPEMLGLYFTTIPLVTDDMIANAREKIPDIGDSPDNHIRDIFQQVIAQKLEPNMQVVNDALRVLERRGLVERETATDRSVASIRIHDLAYTYARATHSKETLNKALDTCIAYTWRYNEPALETYAALHPELDNFIGASAWAFTEGRLIDCERFAWNLYPIGGSRFLNLQGFYTQAITLLELAAQAAEKRGDRFDQAAHLGNLGLAYDSLGQYDKAILYYEQILVIHRDIGDRQGEGNDLGNLGNVYDNIGQSEKAIEYYQQALQIAREIDDKRGEGNRLGSLGNAYFNLKQYDQSIESFEQSLQVALEIGDKQMEGNVLGNLGIAYKNLGEYSKAIGYYERALVISREIGDRMGQANRLNNIATLYGAQENYSVALDYFQQSRVIYAEIGAQHRVKLVDDNIASTQRQLLKIGNRASSTPNSDAQTLSIALVEAYRNGGEMRLRQVLKDIGVSPDKVEPIIQQFLRMPRT